MAWAQCLRVVSAEVFSSLVIGSDGLIPVTLALLEEKKKLKQRRRSWKEKGKVTMKEREG